jgi:Ca2+-dependent lipid-binding protein
VYIKAGKQTKQSQTINNGGKTPNFNNQELLMFCDDKSWKDDLEVSVYDDNVGSDALIGTSTFSLLNLMNPEDRSDADVEEPVKSYSLQHKGKGAGELRMGVRYLPAGKLTVKCVSGRKLRNPDSFGKSDPYIELSVDSQIKPQGDQKFKTSTHSDGGADPQWNFDCEMDIIDQYEISVKCLDKDLLSSDLIGSATVSLLDLFADAAASENSTATSDIWLPLSYDAGKKGMLPAGDVHLILYFVGAAGTTYPLYRPTITGDTAGMDGEDAGKEIEQAGDVLGVTPVTSATALSNIPAHLTDIRRGQLSLTLHSGKNVKGNDSSLQCYVVARLCDSKKGAFKKKSKTTKQVTEGDPQFVDEKLLFDIIDIEKLRAATKNDGESYSLTLELYDDNYISDKCIGKTVIQVKDLLLRPTVLLKQDFELDGNGGTLTASLQFLASYAGLVKMTLIEGRNLPNMGGMMDTQDPYERERSERKGALVPGLARANAPARLRRERAAGRGWRGRERETPHP